MVKIYSEDELQDALDAWHGNRNHSAAARSLNIPRTTYLHRLQRAQETGMKPNQKRAAPEGHVIKGLTTRYDGKGNVKEEWVKTDLKYEKQRQALLATADALKAEIIKEKPVTPPKTTKDNLLSCYVITDYHLGQLSWGEETGADWDVEIAERLLINWFYSAIQTAPDSKVGVLAQLGDFLHWDGLEAITPTSGHILDADTRFPKLVKAAVRVLRQTVRMMLEKHGHVHIIMAEGNHDLASSVWLREMFTVLYEDEPRVSIDNTHLPYYSYEWGETSLFFHHGHKKRISDISKVFAGMYREIFGRTKYSYGHVGHLHHRDVKEDALMEVEQHQTLAAKDAHSARGGYISNRGACVITYSKTSGEVHRSTIRPEINV